MGCVVNCIFIMLNMIVLLVGLAVVSLASYVVYITKDYNKLIMDGVMLLPVWTLIAGLILTFFGFFGCCGTLKKSSCMLRLYGGLVLAFLCMELVCGVLLLVNRDYVSKVIEDRMRRMFAKYGGEDQALTDTIDIAQHDLKCCGIKSYEDWFYILNTHDVTPGCCTGQGNVDSNNCYRNINELIYTQIEKQIYTTGCYDSMKDELASESMALGILVIVSVVIQLCSIIFSFVSASKISREKDGKFYNNIRAAY